MDDIQELQQGYLAAREARRNGEPGGENLDFYKEQLLEALGGGFKTWLDDVDHPEQ
jgi:hypothetical protein